MKYLREIWSAFAAGAADKKLSIIADLFAIFGVSLVTLMSPLIFGLEKARISTYAELVSNVLIVTVLNLFIVLLATLVAVYVDIVLNDDKFRIARLISRGIVWLLAIAAVVFFDGVALDYFFNKYRL